MRLMSRGHTWLTRPLRAVALLRPVSNRRASVDASCQSPRRTALFALVMGAVLVGASSPLAAGQSDLDAARAAVAETTERLEVLVADLAATQARGNELAGQYWQVEANLVVIDELVAAADARRIEIDDQRTGLLGEVRRVAVDRYVQRSLQVTWTPGSSLADREAAEALASLFVGGDQAALDALAVVDAEAERASDELAARRADQQAALDDVEATQRQVGEELAALAELRADIERELATLDAALADLEAAAAAQARADESARLDAERRRAEQAAAAAAVAAQVTAAAPTAGDTAAAAPTNAGSVPTAQATVDPGPAPETIPTVGPTPDPGPAPETIPTAQATVGPTPDPGPAPETIPTVEPTPDPGPAPETIPTVEPTPDPGPAPAPGPIAPAGGGIVCPLAGPFTHVDDFSAPRAVGGVHRANDLIAATGTPVLAVAAGTIEHRESRVGGLSAHLRGDNGDYYFYTHLNGYENVGVGRVSAGTVIGYVGMTGNAPIPHLHFEIHRGGYGNYSNPYGPVRVACGT